MMDARQSMTPNENEDLLKSKITKKPTISLRQYWAVANKQIFTANSYALSINTAAHMINIVAAINKQHNKKQTHDSYGHYQKQTSGLVAVRRISCLAGYFRDKHWCWETNTELAKRCTKIQKKNKKASIRWQDSAPPISGYWPTSEPNAG